MTTPAENDFQAELDEALLALDELALDSPEEALAMFETLPEAVQGRPEFQLALARANQAGGQLEAARDLAEGVIESEYAADAHHLLGDLLEDLGEDEEAGEHFRAVLKLDRQAFEESSSLPPGELIAQLEKVLAEVISGLPGAFSPRLEGVPYRVKLLPSEKEVNEGIDPRVLCHWFGQESSGGIVIFAANIDAEFGDLEEEEEFGPPVVMTVLQTIADHLQLSESERSTLGLDQEDEIPGDEEAD